MHILSYHVSYVDRDFVKYIYGSFYRRKRKQTSMLVTQSSLINQPKVVLINSMSWQWLKTVFTQNDTNNWCNMRKWCYKKEAKKNFRLKLYADYLTERTFIHFSCGKGSKIYRLQKFRGTDLTVLSVFLVYIGHFCNAPVTGSFRFIPERGDWISQQAFRTWQHWQHGKNQSSHLWSFHIQLASLCRP